MPDWKAPFHAPKLTDEEYARQKYLYNQKYGYTISIPGLSDIIKVHTEKPMTLQEDTWWRRKQYGRFTPQRLEEIQKMKAERRERYIQMLASPTPAIAQNVGSIICAIDDAQDAISTLAVIGKLASKVAPRLLGKLIRGPTGVIMAVADMLNMVQQAGMFCMAPMYGKKAGQDLGHGSPRTRSLKARYARRLNRAMPTKGDWIQGAQVTEQVFGFGISLGPIMGLMSDIFWGAVRSRPGVYPKVKFPMPDWKSYQRKASHFAKSLTVLWGTPHGTKPSEVVQWAAAADLVFQQLMDAFVTWHPLDALDEATKLEVFAPIPWHTLTQEVISELGFDLYEHVGWPQTGKKWESIGTIQEFTEPVATHNLHSFLEKQKNTWEGWHAGCTAVNAAFYAIAGIEGEEDIMYENNSAFRACMKLLESGRWLEPGQPIEKFELFLSYLQDCEDTKYDPTVGDIVRFCTSPWNDIHVYKVMHKTEPGEQAVF